MFGLLEPGLVKYAQEHGVETISEDEVFDFYKTNHIHELATENQYSKIFNLWGDYLNAGRP